MADNIPPQDAPLSKRDKLMQRLKNKYPDRDYPDDEAMLGQVDEDYDDYDSKLNGYKDREARLVDLFNKDPKSAQFITDMARGNDPWIAMIKRIGIDGMTDLINDPDRQEEFSKANQEYLERIAKEQQLEQEYKANLQSSLETLQSVQQQRGLSDEQIDAAFDLIGKIANEAILGKFSEQSIDMALKALDYDSAVDQASAEGEVRGRNGKIQQTLRRPPQGDGQPVLSGSNNDAGGNPDKQSIFSLAADA